MSIIAITILDTNILKARLSLFGLLMCHMIAELGDFCGMSYDSCPNSSV
jgi:hypothetical protein